MNYCPLVTIQIPCYNQEKYISNAINSALNQNYENLEIIISDDNSIDSSLLIAKKFELLSSKIKVFSSNKNIGRVKNYHKLLYKYASGKYVLNLDADDTLTNYNFISKAVNLLESNKNAIMFIGCKSVDNNLNLLHPALNTNLPIILRGEDYVFGIPSLYKFSHLTTVYNRNLAINYNFYSKNIISTDKESILKLALFGNVILINEIYGNWNKHLNNTSTNQSFNESVENFLWIKSVSIELSKINKYKSLIWEFKNRILYSQYLYKSLKTDKTITFSNLYKLFKNFLFFFLLLYIFFYALKKINKSIYKIWYYLYPHT
jgi:glycosyltransferase involved in cell wall biosynthesis